MISILDLLMTRFLRISSIALLVGSQFVIPSSGSLELQSPFYLDFAYLMLDLCASDRCSFDVPTAQNDRELGVEGGTDRMLYGFNDRASVLEAKQSEMNWLANYIPPTCSDTDADQTNNCGPNDSGDAGTRMAV